jgi:hypothetical protein
MHQGEGHQEYQTSSEWATGWGGITRSFGLGSEDLAGFEVFFCLATGAGLGACVTLGTDFVVLPTFLVFATLVCTRATVTGPTVGCGSVGEVAVTTWRAPPDSLSARHRPFAVFNRHSLCKHRFGLLPLHKVTVVGCVVPQSRCFEVQHSPER